MGVPDARVVPVCSTLRTRGFRFDRQRQATSRENRMHPFVRSASAGQPILDARAMASETAAMSVRMKAAA